MDNLEARKAMEQLDEITGASKPRKKRKARAVQSNRPKVQKIDSEVFRPTADHFDEPAAPPGDFQDEEQDIQPDTLSEDGDELIEVYEIIEDSDGEVLDESDMVTESVENDVGQDSAEPTNAVDFLHALFKGNDFNEGSENEEDYLSGYENGDMENAE
jgi:hypothetical protein